MEQETPYTWHEVESDGRDLIVKENGLAGLAYDAPDDE